jgi:hypothetical protein
MQNRFNRISTKFLPRLPDPNATMSLGFPQREHSISCQAFVSRLKSRPTIQVPTPMLLAVPNPTVRFVAKLAKSFGSEKSPRMNRKSWGLPLRQSPQPHPAIPGSLTVEYTAAGLEAVRFIAKLAKSFGS